ncbi:MAG: ABC transporter permease [Caldilineae bacterium]|nr:ABC transporter permease [Anaerolineae bacterium]MCB0205703.1 ABC transporter permease [Anaerolineae bacterium]MCB0255494.1 ABC transporter permease [Anaerolineae bacterium]MCB9153721.1 ABC transporter permease [Caldilineae bacterium]
MELSFNERDQASRSKILASYARRILGRQETGIILLSIALTIFFYFRNPAMLSPITVVALLRTMAFPALIAMGMVQLMIAGEIDLSTGAVMSLSAVFAAKLIRDAGFSIPLAVVCSLGAAALVGLANAAITVKVGVPSVITTIGTMFIVRGISYSFTNGLPIYPLPPEVGIIGSWRPLGISFTFFLALGVMVIVQILLSWTRWGSALFATGGNKIAAEVCGINTDRVKTISFVVTSLLAGMAGLLTMSQLPLTPGDPIIGKNLELHVLVGVIIGGVSFYGGRGSAVGAFFGVLFIQLVKSGLVIGRFDSFLQTPVLGVLLVLAAVTDVLRHRKDEG